MEDQQYAMLIEKDNLNLITAMNNGIEPGPECLNNRTYFVSPLDPDDDNDIMNWIDFHEKFKVVQVTKVFVIVKK